MKRSAGAVTMGVLLLAAPSVAVAADVVPVVTAASPITTAAGTGAAGFAGDGGQAQAAQLYEPRDTAVGPDGSVFIADTYNHRIRRVAPDGTISTVAGNGVGGFGGDNGAATLASIRLPHDVTVSDQGVLYIADSNNHRIRRVGADGVITTIAGTGAVGFNGDNRLATTARLRNPKSVALFDGSLFFADGLNHRIRRIDLTTGIISTVVGTGVAGYGGDGGPAVNAMLNTPQRIAFDSTGNLYIADTLNYRVRRVDAASQTITTVAGRGTSGFSGDGGPAVNAQLKSPRGIALAGDSILYIADTGNNRVRMVDLSTGVIRTVVGSGKTTYTGDGGPAGSAGLKNPRGLTVDVNGDLLVADTFHSVIRRVTASSTG